MERLRISRVRLRRVRIPLRVTYVSSMYVMPATVRTVIELETEEGATGLGETLGTEDVFRLTAALAARWLAADPRDRRGLDRLFGRSIFDNRNGRNGWSALGGLEIAAWDLHARRLGCSLAALWGGPLRSRIPIVSPVPSVVLEEPASPEAIGARYDDLAGVDAVTSFARDLAGRCGVAHFKYKSAGRSARWDLHLMTELRRVLGPGAGLRFDPNAAYPVTEAIALCRALDPLDLEFFEDPTDDLEGLAAVRSRVKGKVATNMFVVQTDQLAAAVRRGGVDVLLGDVYMWGGVDRLRAMAAVAGRFGFEVGIHSLFETGIGTALNLHLVATMPEVTRATDTGLHLLARDVTTGANFAISGGAIDVPDGPGLGVTLDAGAMEELTIDERIIDGR